MDRKTENPTGSAICALIEQGNWKFILQKAYLDVVHTIILENLLFCSLGLHLCDLCEYSLHGLWRTQLEISQDFMQIWLCNKAFRAWMIGRCRTAATEICRFLSVLRFD